MRDPRYRVLTVASHPVPYAVHVFRALSHRPELDFQVAFCSLRGAETAHDREFGVAVQWDVPLLDGYTWTHVPNQGSGAENFFRLYNPGFWKLIRLESEAIALGIASRVRILGFVNQSQLPAIYSSADIFVLPSSYDPCPVVVCEAMVCGLPAVLSDEIRGRFDLVQRGVTGDIFPRGNVEALAANLHRLLSDRTVLATFSANARARMATWSPRENVAATIAAITHAVAHRRGHHLSPATSPDSDSPVPARGSSKP